MATRGLGLAAAVVVVGVEDTMGHREPEAGVSSPFPSCYHLSLYSGRDLRVKVIFTRGTCIRGPSPPPATWAHHPAARVGLSYFNHLSLSSKFPSSPPTHAPTKNE